MEHLHEERLLEHVLDGTVLDAAARAHLAVCDVCQTQLAAYVMLRDELALARASTLSPAQEARLLALLGTNGQARTSVLASALDAFTGWIQAVPLWDSRERAMSAGVRSGGQGTYRLLFGAETTEVELMVEPHNGALRVIGEIMLPDAPGQNGTALIELMTRTDAKSALETESDISGRFALEQVPPGSYVMTVTPRFSQVVVIEPLELT